MKLVPLALALVALSVPAYAEARQMALPSFEALDTNKDGKIDRDEARLAMPGRMAGADTDGNGFVTVEELTAHLAADAQRRAETRAQRMIERMDSDKDGKLSQAELASVGERRQDRMARLFDRVDRDDDGAISQAEYDRAVERMQEHRGKGGHEGRQGRMGSN